MTNYRHAGIALLSSTTMLLGCQTTDMTKALSDYGFPVPNQAQQSSTGTKVFAGASGCAIGGVAAYYGTKYLTKKMREKGHDMTNKEAKDAAMVVAGLGCVVGGKIALSIIKNMDEKSKQAQAQAWELAQQQSKVSTTRTPQAWKTDTHEGTVEIIEPTASNDGKECATRRNYIKTEQGEAEQFIPVCKDENGTYQQVTA